MLNYEALIKTTCFTRDRETKWLNRPRKYDAKCIYIYIFGSWVQHAMKNRAQSELRFCKNEGQKGLRSMKMGINSIENKGENVYKMLKNC